MFSGFQNVLSSGFNDVLIGDAQDNGFVAGAGNDTIDGGAGMDMNDILREVAPEYFSTGEQEEGANAFLEKRKPDFSRWR